VGKEKGGAKGHVQSNPHIVASSPRHSPRTQSRPSFGVCGALRVAMNCASVVVHERASVASCSAVLLASETAERL
jgi:hypothetical protein